MAETALGSLMRGGASTIRRMLATAPDRAVLASAPPAQSANRILVVRLDAIGDFILWLEAAKALRILYPRGDYQVTLLANRAWASLADTQGIFDRVWHLDKALFRHRAKYRYDTLLKVRAAGFSTAIQPTYSREDFYGDSVVRASGASVRVGSVGDCSNLPAAQKTVNDGWYTRLVDADSKPLMELIRNAEFTRGLGLPDFRAAMPSLEVGPNLPNGFDATPYYVLFPGSTWTGRQWPLANFAEIARRIFEAVGWVGVVCGGSEETQLGETLVRIAGAPVLNWAGRTSLEELATVIKGAQLLIGNETGAAHIAAAVSTPAISITGGGHFGRFLPYQLEVATDRPLPVAIRHDMDCFRCNWQCVHPVRRGQPMPCVANITVGDAWEAVRVLLGVLP